MENFVTNVDSFVHVLDEVTTLRVKSQQKRKALVRSRDHVSRKDAAIANKIRHQLAIGLTLNQEEFLALSTASLEARDELGPLEDDFEKIEYQLVPKEDDLKERGEELKRQWAILKLNLGRPVESPSSVRPSSSRHSQSNSKDDTPVEAMERTIASIPTTRGRSAHRLSRESLLQLPDSQAGFDFRSHGTTQSEPLVSQYAPDLYFGNSWSPTSHLVNSPSPKSVNEEDLPDVKIVKTDIPDEGNAVLLGNRGPSFCPFLDELATLEYTPFGRRVSFWLLCRLQSSRLEVLRLKDVIDMKAKGRWKWSDILRNWATDDAATSTTPIQSVNICHTALADKSWRHPMSLEHSMSEPRPFGRSAFGLPFTAVIRANKHPRFGRNQASLR